LVTHPSRRSNLLCCLWFCQVKNARCISSASLPMAAVVAASIALFVAPEILTLGAPFDGLTVSLSNLM
jgi:hypothetical protein